MKALISNIQGYSIHDGPGIRTVVFLKGCPLHCRWCANPEGISPEVQIGFIKGLCTNCGKCFEVCPEGALSRDASKHRVDYSKCTACGQCVDACYYKAMVQYGKFISVEEGFDAVRRDKMFYDTSGGGVTVSGGEPLMQAPFVKTLFELCKGAGINTCIETSGFASQEAIASVLPLTDYLLYDLKHLASDIHLKHTGQPNETILKNARFAAENGADILFRIPLIPGVNDDDINIDATAAFIKSLPEGHAPIIKDEGFHSEETAKRLNIRLPFKPRVQLMPYHRLGEGKYKALGLPNPMCEVQVMTPEQLEAVRQKYIDRGIDCTISK